MKHLGMVPEESNRSITDVDFIFAKALQHTPDEWDTFLEQSGTDPDLCLEIKQRLQEHSRVELPFPKKIIGFDVVRQIGAGGMGVVYLALDPKLDRLVALKFLHFGSGVYPEAISRFQKEMRAVAKLSHQNIVTAYHASEEDGNQVLVMEYVPGQDLATLIKENGPVDAEQAIEWTLQASRGLKHAHDAGIVHRDIKPANLLLHENGTIKILDLGLARFESLDTADSGLTQSGMIMGTIDFMAPEQATETKDADQRSDIYSLGCTLYFLLNGKPAYQGDTIYRKIQAHIEQPVPRLKEKSSQLEKELDAVFRRMMAKNPEARFQKIDEVFDHLETLGGKSNAGASGAGRASSLWVAILSLCLLTGLVTGSYYLLNKRIPTVAKNRLALKSPPIGGSGNFIDSGQRLGDQYSTASMLGDIDGDGDLDAVVSNYKGGKNRIWLNDGTGTFKAGSALGVGQHTGMAMGDLDNDGDLDIMFADRNSRDPVWLNHGNGQFAEWGEGLETTMARAVELGDLNGDGNLDVVVSQGGIGFHDPNSVWFGDGEGGFAPSKQKLGQEPTWDSALGDIDGDGDLDIVFANGDEKGTKLMEPNTIWMNDGSGRFTESIQKLGRAFSRFVVMGDLDGDGDMDLVFANEGSPSSTVWLNDGSGVFEIRKSFTSPGEERGVILVDIDSDLDLDLVLTGVRKKEEIRLNDGNAEFSHHLFFGDDLTTGPGGAGDLDGDGDWDLFLPAMPGDANLVWLNEGP